MRTTKKHKGRVPKSSSPTVLAVRKVLKKSGRKTLDDLSRLKKVAYEYYINSDATFKEIARIIHVGEHTVGDWAKAGQWKELRDVMASMPKTNAIALHAAIAKIHEGATRADRTITNDEADAISKLAASIERFTKRITPSAVMQSLMAFNDYLKVVDLNLSKQFIPHMKDFVARELSK